MLENWGYPAKTLKYESGRQLGVHNSIKKRYAQSLYTWTI